MPRDRRRRRDVSTESYSYSDYSESRSPSPRKRKHRSSRKDRHKSSRRSGRDGGGDRRRGGGGGGGGGGKATDSNVDRFIEENELNPDAAARLRTADREVRERVLEQGWNVIDNARNASAVVISRIRKHEQEMGIAGPRGLGGGGGGGGGGRDRSRSPRRDAGGGGGGGGGGGPNDFRDGDWNCRSCGKHNFAKRQECFVCNAPRNSRGGGSRSPSRSRGRR